MILQGKQPEELQQAKGQSDKEPSKGIFGAILNALQTNEDDSGKNLLSGMNSEGGEGESEGENGNGTNTLLNLSALTNRLIEAEAEGASEQSDENSEDAVNHLATEQADSAVSEADNLTEEPGQLSEKSADESVITKDEVSDKEAVEQKSVESVSEGEGKIVEGSGQKVASENELNPVNMNAESEKSDTIASASGLQSENTGNSLASIEIVDGKQIRVESTENSKSDSSVLQDLKSGDNQIAGSSTGINPEGSVNGVENIVVPEKEIVSGSNGNKKSADERTTLQAHNQPIQNNDSGKNRGGEQFFSTDNREQAGRMFQAPEEGTSSGKPRDISVGQILQNGNAGISEAGIAGAAVNSKSVNIDRLREEKEKKMSSRILNTTSSGDQTRSRNISENGSAKSLFSFSAGQEPGSLNISSDEGSMEESVLFWNRFGYEGSESVDENKSNGLHFGLSRLSQIPIMNTTIRQQLLNGIAQSVQKSTGTGKTAETWQKHTFSLENGKNVQISVRQVEGVLHLKLGSTNNELTKLLQMNQQEIKDHLQNEFDIEVDLEFSQQDDGNSSEWFEAMQGQKSSNRGYQASSGGVSGNVTDRQTAGRTVRNFGYNQMEWTA
jgi:hypothetical protein